MSKLGTSLVYIVRSIPPLSIYLLIQIRVLRIRSFVESTNASAPNPTSLEIGDPTLSKKKGSQKPREERPRIRAQYDATATCAVWSAARFEAFRRLGDFAGHIRVRDCLERD